MLRTPVCTHTQTCHIATFYYRCNLCEFMCLLHTSTDNRYIHRYRYYTCSYRHTCIRIYVFIFIGLAKDMAWPTFCIKYLIFTFSYDLHLLSYFTLLSSNTCSRYKLYFLLFITSLSILLPPRSSPILSPLYPSLRWVISLVHCLLSC